MLKLTTRIDDAPHVGPEAAETEGLTLPRRPVAGFLAASAVLIPLLGLSGLWSVLALLCLAGLIATSIAPDPGRPTGRLQFVHWLCAGLPFALLGVTGVGLIAHLVGQPIWQSRTSSLIAWALLVALPMAASWRRPARMAVAPSWSEVVTTSTILVACASVVLVQPFEVWARIVGRGTDFPRHVAMVSTLLSDGVLDYSGDAYPRSAHATVAALQSAAGDTTISGSWQATEGLLLLMLALMAAASALLSIRVMRVLGGPTWLAAVAAPALVAWLMLTGPWIADMLPSGFLTSYEAGLVIAAAALLFWDGAPRVSTAATIGLIGLTVLLAHTWLLLIPVLALPTLRIVWIACRNRSNRLRILLSAELGLLLAIPVLIASFKLLGLEAAATPGGTTLPTVGLLWMAILVAAGAGTFALARAGAAGFARSLVLLTVGLLAVLVVLFILADGTPDGFYYLIKAAWTPLGLLLALAIPVLLFGLWRARGWRRALLAAAVGCAIIFTQPASLADSARAIADESGQAPLTIPLLEQMRAFGPDRPEEILVWGLSPYLAADPDGIYNSGHYDLVALGTLVAAGYQMSELTYQYGLNDHDPFAACEYLTNHPKALRVTGPYPQGPIQWLLDSGCPDAVVRPTSWVSIDIDPSWFTGTEFEGKAYGSDYATWAEARSVVEASIRDREAEAAAR